MILEENHVEFQLTEPQLNFFKAEEKFVAMVAGFGAGKTNTGALRLLNDVYSFPMMNWLWVEPTYPLVRDIFYPKMEEILTAQNVPYKINETKHTVKIEGHGTIFCRTMEKPERIVGFECGHAYLDEFDTEKYEKAMKVWQKVLARIRQKFPWEYPKTGKRFRQQNCIRVMTTPEGFRATYHIFVKQVAEMRQKAQEAMENGDELSAKKLLRQAANYLVVHASTYSNEHNLVDGYIEAMAAAYPSELIDAYLMGLFVNLTAGRVYRSYNRQQNNSDEVADQYETLHIGMDFNITKMSAVVHVLRQGKPHAVSEFYKLKDTPDMICAIRERFPDNSIIVYPDASSRNRSTENAAVTDVKLLSDAGFAVILEHSNPRIKDRVTSMNANFLNSKGEVNYYVNQKTCPNYVDCLEQQAYDSAGNPDKQHDLDHLPDGGGYFIHQKFGISKEKVIQSVLKGW